MRMVLLEYSGNERFDCLVDSVSHVVLLGGHSAPLKGVDQDL